MTEVLNINGKDYRLTANAYTPFLYKKLTGREIFKDAYDKDATVEDNILMTKRLMFCFHLQGTLEMEELFSYVHKDDKTRNEDFFKFIAHFDESFFLNKDNMIKILAIWLNNGKTSTESKNLESPQQDN